AGNTGFSIRRWVYQPDFACFSLAPWVLCNGRGCLWHLGSVGIPGDLAVPSALVRHHVAPSLRWMDRRALIPPVHYPTISHSFLPRKVKVMTTSNRTTYIASRLLTGQKGQQIDNAAITFEGNRILWVGTADNLPKETGKIKNFGENSTILPGLIDTHVHLAFDGSENPVERMKSATTLELFSLMLRSARELLSVGV